MDPLLFLSTHLNTASILVKVINRVRKIMSGNAVKNITINCDVAVPIENFAITDEEIVKVDLIISRIVELVGLIEKWPALNAVMCRCMASKINPLITCSVTLQAIRRQAEACNRQNHPERSNTVKSDTVSSSKCVVPHVSMDYSKIQTPSSSLSNNNTENTPPVPTLPHKNDGIVANDVLTNNSDNVEFFGSPLTSSSAPSTPSRRIASNYPTQRHDTVARGMYAIEEEVGNKTPTDERKPIEIKNRKKRRACERHGDKCIKRRILNHDITSSASMPPPRPYSSSSSFGPGQETPKKGVESSSSSSCSDSQDVITID